MSKRNIVVCIDCLCNSLHWSLPLGLQYPSKAIHCFSWMLLNPVFFVGLPPLSLLYKTPLRTPENIPPSAIVCNVIMLFPDTLFNWHTILSDLCSAEHWICGDALLVILLFLFLKLVCAFLGGSCFINLCFGSAACKLYTLSVIFPEVSG